MKEQKTEPATGTEKPETCPEMPAIRFHLPRIFGSPPLRRLTALVFILTVLVSAQPSLAQEGDEFLRELGQLDLVDLMKQEITSVSRYEQPVRSAAAAVYVITREQILRSGARRVPEMLRLAPGVTVERVSASNWNVTIRGFDTNGSAKLLVLVDGRSIYSPLFSAVLWDSLDIAPEDIERIEVIRGPGAVSWGENAVNGVINIITRHSGAFEGNRIVAGGGNEEQGFGSVYNAGRLSEDTTYRIGSRFQIHDALEEGNGGDAGDDWQMYGLNFRLDSELSHSDTLEVNADMYLGDAGQKRTLLTSLNEPFFELDERATHLGGGFLLSKWTRKLADGGTTSLQAYYDHSYRSDTVFRKDRDTFDLDFQHQFSPFEGHHLIWGSNVRFTSDDIRGSFAATADPLSETDFLATAFLMDEIEIPSLGLNFIPGAKIGYNDYTQVEFQPSVKVLKPLGERYSLWSSVSRAVRMPSRIDDDVRLDSLGPPAPDGTPTLISLQGSSQFDSEKLIAYELGLRGEPAESFQFDVTAFFHDYDDLLYAAPADPFIETTPFPPHIVLPVIANNDLTGKAYGAEIYGSWRPLGWLEIAAAYSYLNLEFSLKPGTDTIVLDPRDLENRTPEHQANVRFHFDLPFSLGFDAITYYVDSVPSESVESYIRQDLHLGYSHSPDLSFHLYVHNLFDPDHREANTQRDVEVERTFMAKVRYKFD